MPSRSSLATTTLLVTYAALVIFGILLRPCASQGPQVGSKDASAEVGARR